MGLMTILSAIKGYGAGRLQSQAADERQQMLTMKQALDQAKLEGENAYHQGQLDNAANRNNYSFAGNFGQMPNGAPVVDAQGNPLPGRLPTAAVNAGTRSDAVHGFFDANGRWVQGQPATGQQRADTGQAAVEGFTDGTGAFVPGSAQDRAQSVRMSGLKTYLQNIPAMQANPSLQDALTGNLNSFGVPVHAGTTLNLSAPDQATISLKQAQAAGTDANTAYTKGPKTLLSTAQAGLDNTMAGLAPKKFALDKYSKEQQVAYQQRLLQLKAQGMADDVAIRQAGLELSTGRLNLDTQKYEHPNMPGGKQGVLTNGLTEQQDSSLAQEKIAHQGRLTTIGNLLSVAAGNNTDHPLTPTDKINLRNEFKALQDRNAEIDARRSQTAPAPLPAAPNGSGMHIEAVPGYPHARIPGAPPLPPMAPGPPPSGPSMSLPGQRVFTNRAGVPTAVAAPGVHSDPMFTIKGVTLPRSQWLAIRAKKGK